MKNFIAIFLMALMSFSMTACVTGSEGAGGVKVVEDMDASQFANVLNYTEVGTRVAASQLLKRTDVNSDILLSVATALRDAANEDAVTVVSGILSDVSNRVLKNFPVPKAAIGAVLRFVEGRVEIGVIQEDGTIAITDRTKLILGAVASGLEQAVATDALGMTDPDENNEAYRDFANAARDN